MRRRPAGRDGVVRLVRQLPARPVADNLAHRRAMTAGPGARAAKSGDAIQMRFASAEVATAGGGVHRDHWSVIEPRPSEPPRAEPMPTSESTRSGILEGEVDRDAATIERPQTCAPLDAEEIEEAAEVVVVGERHRRGHIRTPKAAQVVTHDPVAGRRRARTGRPTSAGRGCSRGRRRAAARHLRPRSGVWPSISANPASMSIGLPTVSLPRVDPRRRVMSPVVGTGSQGTPRPSSGSCAIPVRAPHGLEPAAVGGRAQRAR